MTRRELQPILDHTQRFHEALFALWHDLPMPQSRRALVVSGYCNIVRQHAIGQAVLADAGLDVSATTLVRPAFEALVRGMWCLAGASEEWIETFLTPTPDALAGDAETAMGPPVHRMLQDISAHHPADIHAMLVRLKDHTWRGMHSYVHGGIRPVVQGMVDFREHEVAGVVLNANGMLLYATHILRMSRGLRLPQLPEIQRQYADCLPPVQP